MLKRFYISRWFWSAMAALSTALAGTLNEASLLIFSLVALALLGRAAPPRAVKDTNKVLNF